MPPCNFYSTSSPCPPNNLNFPPHARVLSQIDTDSVWHSRPGWTYTGIGGSSGELSQKPEGAWTATQTVQYMLLRVKAGQFYIICPDNETTPQLDALRIQWAADDIVNARPALSRWHPEYKVRQSSAFVFKANVYCFDSLCSKSMCETD